MSKPIRVLQINSGSGNFGGVSSFLYNTYTHIDRSKVQFDFLSPDKTTYGIHSKEIRQMGGEIFEFKIKGNIITRKIKLYSKLKRFVKENDYKIVHINSGNIFFNFFTSAAIKKAGVPVRIVHSHNAGDTSGMLKRMMFGIMRPLIEKNATDLFSCSMLAADYMFTKKTVDSGKVKVIPNGIDTEKFAYNEAVRTQMRRDLGLEDKFVVGNIARFMPQKNHRFLIEIFEQITKQQDNAILLLVGQGELEDEIKALVHSKKLDDKVVFLGQRSDVEKIYQAMDVFVLPSIHEGFPVTGVEVQCSGLPFVLSDSITKEIRLTENTYFVSLKRNPQQWAEVILNTSSLTRKDMSKEIADKGYSEKNTAEILKNRYIECLEVV